MLFALLSSLAACGGAEPASDTDPDPRSAQPARPAGSSDLAAPVANPVQLGDHVRHELRQQKELASEREDVFQQAVESNR